MSAYTDAVNLLTRRALTVAECRERLRERQHPDVDIDKAIDHLLETGGLDDRKVATAYARTAAEIKGRGRLRIQRELYARGIDRETATEAIADVFGDKDERAMIARAVQKKLRGRARPADEREYARLYQHLMRQGFTPAAVTATLRNFAPAKRRSTGEIE